MTARWQAWTKTASCPTCRHRSQTKGNTITSKLTDTRTPFLNYELTMRLESQERHLSFSRSVYWQQYSPCLAYINTTPPLIPTQTHPHTPRTTTAYGLLIKRQVNSHYTITALCRLIIEGWQVGLSPHGEQCDGLNPSNRSCYIRQRGLLFPWGGRVMRQWWIGFYLADR